jgi:plastocyanin
MMPRLMRGAVVMATIGAAVGALLGLGARGPATADDLVPEVQAAPAAAAAPAPPADLAGRIDIKEKNGTVAPAAGVVVWVEGAAPPAAAPTVTPRDKRFAPHVVAVSAGGTVTFPNVDPIFHNVFSRTPGSEFDLGLYRKGARRSIKLAKPGLVRVYCNIHPEMAAYVMVLDGAGYTVTGEDGTFLLRGIPAGRRVVRLWSERGGQSEQPLVFKAGGHLRLDATLDASAYRPTAHKNKFGQDYPAVTRDVDRY